MEITKKKWWTFFLFFGGKKIERFWMLNIILHSNCHWWIMDSVEELSILTFHIESLKRELENRKRWICIYRSFFDFLISIITYRYWEKMFFGFWKFGENLHLMMENWHIFIMRKKVEEKYELVNISVKNITMFLVK